MPFIIGQGANYRALDRNLGARNRSNYVPGKCFFLNKTVWREIIANTKITDMYLIETQYTSTLLPSSYEIC